MRYEARTVMTSSFRNRKGQVLGKYKIFDTESGRWAKATIYSTMQKANDAANKMNSRIGNPSILKKLRKGIRGHIKLSHGRLIIKT